MQTEASMDLFIFPRSKLWGLWLVLIAGAKGRMSTLLLWEKREEHTGFAWFPLRFSKTYGKKEISQDKKPIILDYTADRTNAER